MKIYHSTPRKVFPLDISEDKVTEVWVHVFVQEFLLVCLLTRKEHDIAVALNRFRCTYCPSKRFHLETFEGAIIWRMGFSLGTLSGALTQHGNSDQAHIYQYPLCSKQLTAWSWLFCATNDELRDLPVLFIEVCEKVLLGSLATEQEND